MNVIRSLDAREPPSPWILLMLGINTIYFFELLLLDD